MSHHLWRLILPPDVLIKICIVSHGFEQMYGLPEYSVAKMSKIQGYIVLAWQVMAWGTSGLRFRKANKRNWLDNLST